MEKKRKQRNGDRSKQGEREERERASWVKGRNSQAQRIRTSEEKAVMGR